MSEELTTKKDVPTYAFLQSSCIEIKVSLKNEPIKLDSPLEAYSCIGKLRKAFNLPCELQHDKLQDDMNTLKNLIGNREAPTERVEKIQTILFNFGGNCQREHRHEEIMEYAYEIEGK